MQKSIWQNTTTTYDKNSQQATNRNQHSQLDTKVSMKNHSDGLPWWRSG